MNNQNADDTTFRNDHFLQNMPQDTISQLKFYPDPNQHFLLAGSWDNKATMWQIFYQVNTPQNMYTPANKVMCDFRSNPMYQETFDNPVLSVAWQRGSTNYFAGIADGSIFLVDAQKKCKTGIGRHNAGCKEVVWLNNYNALLTGGWDSRVCIWDLRNNSGNPALSYNLPNRVASLSSEKDLLVVAMANKIITYFNLTKLNQNTFQPEATFASHLKFQTRKVACFPNGQGYALGSIEGRVAIKNISFVQPLEINKDTGIGSMKDDYAFRCHRLPAGGNVNEAYPVNDIAFNPVYGTFVTVGGDGNYIIWDKDNKSRIKQAGNDAKTPLTACDYSANGELLAFAMGYDWSRGINGDNHILPQIGIHYLTETQRKKPK